MTRSTVAQDAHAAEYRRLMAAAGCTEACGLRVGNYGGRCRLWHGDWFMSFGYSATEPLFDRMAAWLRAQHDKECPS